MSAHEALDAFRDAIGNAGLTPPDQIIADGALHRFSSNGKAGDDSGYYVLHLDGVPAGLWGCWRTDVRETFRYRNGRQYSSAEMREYRRRIAEAKQLREAEEAQRHAKAGERALAQWNAATPAAPDHPYLCAKGIKPNGVRQLGDVLLIPVRIGTRLASLQRIGPDGSKKFLPDGATAGGYHLLRNLTDAARTPAVLCIAEGFATACSVHEATGWPVAVAFSAHNLEPVAKTLRAQYPETRLIVCADDDYRSKGNPGMTSAAVAARAVNGTLAAPDFGPDRPEGATDFNDLARHRGAEAVRDAVVGATRPDASAAEPKADAKPETDTGRRFWRFDRLITGVKAPRYLVYPILETDSVGLLFGDSMAFKTFVALELAMSVSSGQALHGWQAEQGAVFLIVGEGQGGIRRRLLAQSLAKATASLPLYVCAVPVALIEDADTEAMAALIRETAQADGVEPRLIIIDTMTRNMGGGDESSNADINKLLDHANKYLRQPFGACVLLVHHVGHSDKTRTRGAYSLLGNVDFQIRAERQPNSDSVVLFCAKTKDAPEWEPVAFEALPVVLPGLENPDGTPVTSLTLRRLDKVPEPAVVTGAQEKALAKLNAMLALHRQNLEAGGYDPDTARVSRKEWQEALKADGTITDRRRFHEMVGRLLTKGIIREAHGYVSPA